MRAPDRTRTCNLGIRRPLLYPLSYGGDVPSRAPHKDIARSRWVEPVCPTRVPDPCAGPVCRTRHRGTERAVRVRPVSAPGRPRSTRRPRPAGEPATLPLARPPPAGVRPSPARTRPVPRWSDFRAPGVSVGRGSVRRSAGCRRGLRRVRRGEGVRLRPPPPASPHPTAWTGLFDGHEVWDPVAHDQPRAARPPPRRSHACANVLLRRSHP